MVSLHDVYEELKAPKAVKASYIMQFLWRDLTSDFYFLKLINFQIRKT